jgi:hypothetical protein
MVVFHRYIHGKISLFRVNEIGKSRVVLRLYSVTGVVSLNTPVVARYEYPVFNLVVVAQRRRRNARKRTEHAELPIESASTFPACSASFRFFGRGLPENFGVGQVYLAFAIGYCLGLSVNVQ